MPSYEDDVIMAAGTFIQGPSMELSADAPVRPPCLIYLQGGLTYEHIKIAVSHAVNEVFY
ncbi:methionine gamma-lyase family protein [Enterococcus sp. BWB1-3]|uniref:methionine gamma-lyase family protein n=1 Tax=Enterococcus sp. BWB1-3 TaxID=2787713 RepID=UPI00192495AE|nr:methionine gamma-lyase family protein [Enterococcus sp. BWB1-3]MBL1229649.1 methionine gamma-lyase family protein [Enterococcus sp. BWB1-3]